MSEDDKKLEMTQKELDELLTKARNEGSQIKYRGLLSFIFAIIEYFSNIFKPENMQMPKFMAAVLNTLVQEYNKKYVKQDEEKKDEEKKEVSDQGDQEASKE